MPFQTPLKLASPPGTDLWKKPPAHNAHDAPRAAYSSNPVPDLVSLKTSFSATYTTQFDQAGFYVSLRHPDAAAEKWIKAGVELFDGAPRLSVVCCDNYSDWSMVTLPADVGSAVARGAQDVTFELERDDVTLWVYTSVAGGERIPMREIAWTGGLTDGWTCEVGALVARVNTEVEGDLEATFSEFDVQWKKQ